ncbi:E3 ubiquitin-protein ligase RNF4-like [Neopelma chrysocephalum]|uniref:E3 ubiquitin-protein ligase RNF4-like n=1 Tax=Neopelma chrysocephalum TaxID=114329 RepID=UPI000FCD270D|nr:E3 ubiquitin-protein ligase RNF4-like [Neopelma chrysocephalum]
MKLLEGYAQQRRNLTPRSQQLLDSPVLRSDDEDETADDVTDVESEVADVEPEVTDVEPEVTEDSAEGGSSDEETANSEEWQRAVRCPICMDFYSRILRKHRQVVSTQCGHLFCSRCLPFALQTSWACPTCRTELPPRAYHRIFF